MHVSTYKVKKVSILDDIVIKINRLHLSFPLTYRTVDECYAFGPEAQLLKWYGHDCSEYSIEFQ